MTAGSKTWLCGCSLAGNVGLNPGEVMDIYLLGVLRVVRWWSLRRADHPSRAVLLNRRTATRYRALASITLGRERTEETAKCYKISLVQLITNLNVILYLSTYHTVHISALMLFMIMPKYIINLLKPNDIYIYIYISAPLTSRRYILNIYSTNIRTEYFKHAA